MGRAGCVLFRALEPLTGIEEMAAGSPNRLVLSTKTYASLTSGPGRLCAAFCITREPRQRCDLTSPESSLWIGDDGFRAGRIAISPRIGITKAAEQPPALLPDRQFLRFRPEKCSSALDSRV